MTEKPTGPEFGSKVTQVILADNALLAAFVSGTATIGPDIIHEVVKDRGLPDTHPLPPPRAIKKHKAGSSISSLRRAGDGRDESLCRPGQSPAALDEADPSCSASGNSSITASETSKE